jgi:LPXTG-motif cell wall-anchored protein
LRKVMLLAAMLAMVLAAAAPSFAQTATGGDVAVLQYSCDQIQAAVNTQYQQGEGAGAVAGAAQSLGIDQQQVLACFGTAAAAQDSVINIGTGTATAGGDGDGGGGGGGSASAAAGGELPDTGGASLIALGAGALLVAGGLLARRIVR